jgi:hypothetical protein
MKNANEPARTDRAGFFVKAKGNRYSTMNSIINTSDNKQKKGKKPDTRSG